MAAERGDDEGMNSVGLRYLEGRVVVVGVGGVALELADLRAITDVDPGAFSSVLEILRRASDHAADADLHAGHPDLVAVLQLLERVERGARRGVGPRYFFSSSHLASMSARKRVLSASDRLAATVSS